MSDLRVVHYLNQSFGRVGGEEAGDFAFTVREGPLGPGTKLEQELGGAGRVVATLICGDNRAATDLSAFGGEVERALGELRPDVVVAGPAFNAGRYGLACGEVCARASALGIPAVTAMHTENPGVEIHRRKAYILPAAPTALGMNDALQRLARFAVRLGRREGIGTPKTEGYFGRGVRTVELQGRRAADRALDMLAARLRGDAFTTEMPLPAVERTAPAPPVEDLSGARVAVVTTGGIVPKGNPDGLKQSNSTEWRAYSIEGLAALEPGTFESIHGGYDTSWANANPNYVVPLDALRELEREGAFAAIHPRYYMTVGVGTAVAEARRMGREIAQDLRAQDVDAVILTATWGTCNRCGAAISAELERAGMPTAMISALGPVALELGANRVVRGVKIPHPCGDPTLDPARDRALRVGLVRGALRALATKLEKASIFEGEAA